MSDQLAQINNAAHQGAFGHNPRSEPTLAQLAAGNYKKGVVMVKGLSIAIENPAYTYRKGIDKSGQQWMCLMQAHYGYIQGYKGNDGDEMDVFIGNVPENDTVYIVNQKTADGYFDEHKIMLGFLSQQQAVDTYQHCFERGWTGLMSVVPCTMTQFKWWLANGDKSRPVTLDRLPYAGLERLDSVIWGGNDGSDLASHSGQVHKLLYQIRQCDDTHQALEPLSYNDLVQELGNQGFMYENYDALVVEYNKLEKKAKQLLMVMQGAASTVKPMGVTVGKPLTKGGVANVVAWFEMDDGQAVGVFFHNPDKTPKKIDPTDEMISYKWVLNKKDITIAVAPEQGKDLIIRTVAKRIMQLVEKNHDRFIKANGDKAALNQAEQDLTAQVAEKQATLKGLQGDVAALQAKKAEKEAFTLQSQTEADLRQREAEAQAAEAERLAQEKAAKDKAQADKDAADFRLTGSNLPADVAAAGGQQDLLASDNQKEPLMVNTQSAITVWDGQNADMRLAEILAQNNNDYVIASKAYFTEHLQGTSVQTKIGLVYLNSKSKGKMLHRLRKTTAQVIPRIPEILIDGNVGARELPNKERTDSFVAFYHFDKWLDFEDVRIHARIKVGEMPNGLLAYYLAASSNKEAPSFDSSWAENDESIQARSRTDTRLDAIQADDDEGVNIEILEVVSKVQLVSQPVTLTGKELGDFPDTPEGKKELRAAAKAEFEKLLGEWVDCPALNGLEGDVVKVEIRKRGVKEFLAFSGNPKKLKLVADIANIIKTARVTSNSWQPNIKADTKRSAAGYYHLVNTIKIEDDTLNITVIVEKDNNGLLHYDVLVPSNIADDLDAKKMSKQPVPDNDSGGDLDTEASKPAFDSILDSGEWVVNLFIEGEPIEVVTEENMPAEENPTPTHTDLAPLANANAEEAKPPETDLIGDVDDGLSDHYQDDNYRFKDVGYIAGARKEKAQLAIMQAKKSGQLVSVTDIDWDALEDDSRMAAATIIKKNVFGQVDWDALKDGGMNGNVGYFIKRLYAAVELQPDDDSPDGRKLYVTAIQNLRQLFESCLTMDDAVREIVALSKLLNTHRNMIKGEDGKATLNYDSQVANALGKKFKSWVFKTGNKAIHESRVMANDDWSWLEKSDKPTVSKPKKQGFQLEAASHIQRVGGTEVSIQSTEQFKEAFGLKAIQSGNWVLKDKESIEFHIQRAAESMLDMADVTGIAPELLGFGGRLGLAFGARGKGGALAHYEPVARVINITKMKGGGSLGHEYFHALDNLIQDLVTQQNNGKAGFFATETPHLLPESLTKKAFVTLRTAMLEGDESLTETLKLTDKDFRASAYNMKPEFLERSEVKRNIAAAGNVWDAVLVVDAHFARTRSPRPTRSSNHMDFVKIAAAHYADRNVEFVSIPSLEKGSRFLQDALLLDDFKRGKYWSKPLEMAARAYSSYLQDKLEQQGRTNDYLAYSTKGGNGRVGEEAYPQGKERERIHAAFDDLFKAIKDEQVFEKAVGNKDLMDSVFDDDMDLDELLALGYEQEII